AVAGVAAAVRLGAEVFGLAHVDEGPVAERPAFLIVPEAPLGRAAEVIAVEITRKSFAGAEMNDARMGRIPAIIHLEPVGFLGNLLPAVLHALEVARPGERIAWNGRAVVFQAAQVLDDVFIAGDDTVFAEDEPGHVGVERVPAAAVLNFAVRVAGKGTAASVHAKRFPVWLVPGVHGAAEGVAIREAGAVGIVND